MIICSLLIITRRNQLFSAKIPDVPIPFTPTVAAMNDNDGKWVVPVATAARINMVRLQSSFMRGHFCRGVISPR